MLIQNITRLKTCQWCGKTFRVPLTREYNATKYCCEMHSNFAYLEKHNKAQHEYLKRYDDLFKNSDRPFELGSIGLGGHRENDFEKEMQKIRKELKRLKL